MTRMHWQMMLLAVVAGACNNQKSRSGSANITVSVRGNALAGNQVAEVTRPAVATA